MKSKSIILSLIIISLATGLLTGCDVSKKAYKSAETLFKRGEFEEAYVAFEALGNYNGAAERATEAKYQAVRDTIASVRYDGLPINIVFRDTEYGITAINIPLDKSTGKINVRIRTDLMFTDFALQDSAMKLFPIMCCIVINNNEYKANSWDFVITDKLNEVAVWYYFDISYLLDSDYIPEQVVFYHNENISDRKTVICVTQ